MDLDFPSSLSLNPHLSSEGWSWERFREPGFWVGRDGDGQRWLVKFRGGFCAVRERAFSIIAQALEISCQSSTFLTVSNDCPPMQEIGSYDLCQSAIWLLDEHDHDNSCQSCPLLELDSVWNLNPWNVSVLRNSSVTNAIDIARGEMLGMLCEMFEPPGRLFTCDHRFVQIDNELMFAQGAGANLLQSDWVHEENNIKEDGLKEATILCESILSLSEEIFDAAIRIPAGYRPQMT